jgi:hypothetical protein
MNHRNEKRKARISKGMKTKIKDKFSLKEEKEMKKNFTSGKDPDKKKKVRLIQFFSHLEGTQIFA